MSPIGGGVPEKIYRGPPVYDTDGGGDCGGKEEDAEWGGGQGVDSS